MNSLDRVLESLKLGCPSKVPVIPLIGIHSARLAKTSVFDALRDGKKMAKAQLTALERYGYDGIFPFMDLTVEVEAMGCEITAPKNEVSSVVAPLIDGPADIENLEIPDPQKDGRLPVFLEAVKIISENVGKEVAVCAYVTGPFTLAGHLMGVERELICTIRAPREFHKMLKITAEIGAKYAKALSDVGAHIIMILEPVASPNLISPNHFGEFVIPYISKMADDIRRNERFSILHICGNTTLIMEKMAGAGVNGLNIDAPVDIKLAKEKVGSKVCIMGNVDPISVMLDGSIEDVKKASIECIKNASVNGGFILSSGCEVPRDTPSKNVEAMVGVARKHD